MAKSKKNSRRRFVKNLAASSLIAGGGAISLLAENKKIQHIRARKTYQTNDQVNLGIIGMGIMGFNNAKTATNVPGVKLVAACDLYQGRLARTQEVFGKDVFTTRSADELLGRDDIDAVVIATSDHWHQKLSIAAMEKGKAVYCEKPVVQKFEEGQALLDTQKQTGKVFQVGSQRVSSIVSQKAQDLYHQGAIGELIMVESWIDRYSPMGAWQYSIPRDASPETVDWETFVGHTPKRPFDATRFFRWRNYQDYGTGVPGDLFVHLFSGMHFVTKSLGPNRIYATGGLRYWKDGRDVPDVVIGSYDYPQTEHHSAFNLQMRVNLIDGSGGSSMIRFVGSEGVMTLAYNSVKIEKKVLDPHPGYGGWDSYATFSEKAQKEYEEWYKNQYPPDRARIEPGDTEFKAPKGYSDHLDHHTIFFDAVRNNSPIVEDAAFGLRAGGPAVATNVSYFEKRIVNWDPKNMTEAGNTSKKKTRKPKK